MKDFLVTYLVICLFNILLVTSDEESSLETADEGRLNSISSNDENDDDKNSAVFLNVINKCAMDLNQDKYFKLLDAIDDNYEEVRQKAQKSLEENEFDKEMVKTFKASRGAAQRELNAHAPRMIPSGLNLGGLCMLKMSDSILVFHRMKLRNNTYFHVEALHNDLKDMVVRIRLGLNDLHLKGAFERSFIEKPNILIYAPTFGEVEFFLQNVKYKVEGRYRVVGNRFLIEMISSEILCKNILMKYINQAIESAPIPIEKEELDGFFNKMKTDLDLWLKDYFNDYFALEAPMDGIQHMEELAKYDKEKETVLEEFTDKAIDAIANKIRSDNAESISVPSYTFKTIHGMEIKLLDGVLYGLDTIFRRSVATGYREEGIRKIDSVVGFSNLKVVYKYEAIIPTTLSALHGVLTLSANEFTARLSLAMALEERTVDIDIEFLGQAKPESLTVEGPANLVIANFKHLLEHQILALMSNSLKNGVLLFQSLPSCEKFPPNPQNILLKKENGNEDSASSSSEGSQEFGWPESSSGKQLSNTGDNLKRNHTELTQSFTAKQKKL